MGGVSLSRALAVLLAISISIVVVMLLRWQAQKSEAFEQLCRANAQALQKPPKAIPIADPEVALLLLMHCDYDARPKPAK